MALLLHLQISYGIIYTASFNKIRTLISGQEIVDQNALWF